MAIPRVVLDLDTDRTVRRTGDVVSQDRRAFTVRWDDDTEETIELGRHSRGHYLAVARDGLEHRNLVNRDSLTSLFSEDPVEVFLLALRDSTDRQTSRTLIEKVAQYSSADSASKAWRKVRKAFEESDSVRVLEGKLNRYKWLDPASEADQADGPRIQGSTSPDQPPAARSMTAAAEETSASDRLVGLPPEAHVEPPPPSAPAQPASPPEPSRPPLPSRPDLSRVLVRTLRGDATPEDSAVTSAIDDSADNAAQFLLAVARGKVDRRAAAAMALAPLANGVELAGFTDDILAAALESAGQPLVPAVLGLDRKSKLADAAEAVAMLSHEALNQLLGQAEAELKVSRRRTGNRSPLEVGYARLVDRVAAAPTALPVSVLVGAFGLVDPSLLDEARVNRVLTVLGRALRAEAAAGWAGLSPAVIAKVATWSALQRLQPRSGRAEVLAVVAALDPEAATDSRWWRHLAFDDLAASATGRLAAALDHPAILDRIVGPLARRSVTDAATRRRLMTVLAAPSVVTKTLPAELVRSALVRLAPNEPDLQRWVEAIVDADGRAALESRLQDTAARVDRLSQELAEARQRAAASSERALRLERELAEAADTTTTLRISQERQIRIDAVRALADVASFVEGALVRQPPERVIARVRSLVARQGLERLDEAGAEEPYDPVRHDAVGGTPETGEIVVVRRAGYTWAGPDGEDIVLVRALVEKQG